MADFMKRIDFDDKLKSLNEKVTSNRTKYVVVENKFKKLQTLDWSHLFGQSYFNNNGAQLYFIFQPIYKTITTFSDYKHNLRMGIWQIIKWKISVYLYKKCKCVQNWYRWIILE